MNAHGAGADRVPVGSDVLRNEVPDLTLSARNSRNLPLAPVCQSGRRADRAGVLDSRAQAREVGGCGKVRWIDERWRVRIGARERDASTALRPEETDANRKALVGLDLGRPHRRGREQSVRIGSEGVRRAPKEEMAAST